MIVAELSIFPTSEGASVSKYVKETIKAIKASGLYYVIGGMSTTIEAPDMEALLEVIKKAHEAIAKMGAATIESKLRSLREK